jgi:hypothetical protein
MDARDTAVARILKVAGAYEEDDPITLVTEILTDLMHFSHQNGIRFDRRLEMARRHYDEEHDPLGDYAERFGPWHDEGSGRGEDVAILKYLRATVEKLALRYQPGEHLCTLMHEVSDLCTAELSDAAEPNSE